MSVVYLDIAQAIEIHEKTVNISGGGALAPLEIGKLESVLINIQNDDYYPTFVDKLTHLFFCTCNFHCFLDGNKRLAIVLCTQMLLFNGYLYCANCFLREMENISYHVAAGKINKDLLREIIEACLNGEMEAESLKIKIIDAISS